VECALPGALVRRIVLAVLLATAVVGLIVQTM
jgi:hypothetical protein